MIGHRLALDVETVPLAKSLGVPYPEAERTPPASYKKDEAIAEWRAADRVKWEGERSKACSLSPRLGRVLAIGYAARAHGSSEYVESADYAEQPGDEHAVLVRLTDRLRRTVLAGGMVMTWSGKHFDLPFLALRCALHGIAFGFGPLLKRWQDERHFDGRHVVTGGERRAGDSLDEWADAFGLPTKPGGMNGAEVYPAYLRGEHDRIKEYVQHDARTTLLVCERIAAVML